MSKTIKNDALNLVRKFYYECDTENCALSSESAKRCAIIAAIEMEKQEGDLLGLNQPYLSTWWREVIKEINNLTHDNILMI